MNASREAAPSQCDDECLEREYCAAVSRKEHEDPIGSAPPHRNYLLVEVPLPWAPQVEQSKAFPAGLNETLERCARNGGAFRFLAFCSEFQPSPAGHTRIFQYKLPDAPNDVFAAREYVVPADKVNVLVEALLLDDEAKRSDFAEWLQPVLAEPDLFICTHGSHDSCCGVFGVPLYKRIGEQYAGRARAWRTSHFGGHRHAPTLITFPEGRYWAQVTDQAADILITREAPFDAVARHYRGWGAIDIMAQAAEREAFRWEGWAWTGYRKETRVQRMDDGSARVEIRYRSADETVAGAYEADVKTVGTVKTGGCGYGAGQAKQLAAVKVTRKTDQA